VTTAGYHVFMLSAKWVLTIAFVAGVALEGAPEAAAQLAVPAKIVERAEPVFPDLARGSGVEGDVKFRAAVDANGRVERVEIDSVPEPGLGFEEAVRAAVSRWRFAAARLRDVPVASEYGGTLRFTLSLPGQAMLSASSEDTWTAVRAMVRQLKVPVDKADDKTQLFTSGSLGYLALKLPDAATLNLLPGFRPDRLRLHIYVTPAMQPARVAVGSVMDVVAISPNDTRRFTVYAHEAIARWMLTELARRMGVRMEDMAASAERRAEQSRALMPAGLSDPCTTKPAQLVVMGAAAAQQNLPTIKQPQVLERIQPMYPSDQLEARKKALIAFRGEITEHGTLVNPTMTEPADAPASFVSATQLAFGMWRFAPMEVQGCRARASASFTSSFILK
jgi:TonB family protein